MRYTGTLSVPALGLAVPVEVDLEPVEAPKADDMIDDAALRLRWKCSARTIKRLRDQRRLPYSQPSPRIFVYSLADVLGYEASTRRGAHRRAS